MTLDRKACAFLASQDDASRFDVFADVLEADGRFQKLAIMEFRNSIDQMRRRDGSGHSALPSAAFDKVVEQHCDQFVWIDEFAAFIEDAESIGVPIGGEAQL